MAPREAAHGGHEFAHSACACCKHVTTAAPRGDRAPAGCLLLCVSALISRSTSADELAAAAGALLAHCQEGLPAPVSYNAVLTRSLLLMVPRRAEACGRVAIKCVWPGLRGRRVCAEGGGRGGQGHLPAGSNHTQPPHAPCLRRGVPACLCILVCLCSSLGFAGTILLKCDADRQFAAATGPLNMLAAVGQPWDTAPSSSSS